jgi:hypothetical protein
MTDPGGSSVERHDVGNKAVYKDCLNRSAMQAKVGVGLCCYAEAIPGNAGNALEMLYCAV